MDIFSFLLLVYNNEAEFFRYCFASVVGEFLGNRLVFMRWDISIL